MADPLLGQELGGYRIVRLLKRTGMSMVYLAHDEKLQRDVVIKIMLPTHSGDESFAIRFQQEALATARLAHPNIVHIYDFGQREDLSYMVMEYLPGGSLHDRLVAAAREGRHLDLPQVTAVVCQIALALDHAHQAGIIHRDVKPSNILFASDGRPVLTDLGIARAREGPRLTRTMTAVGTPEYMSPEQSRGDPVDGRSDIYSLGILLYELVCGALPFQADTSWGLLFKHMYEAPPPIQNFNPTVSTALSSVVEKAIAKRPEDRFQTAREMGDALQQALKSPSRRLYPLPPMPQRTTAPPGGGKVAPHSQRFRLSGATSASNVTHDEPTRLIGEDIAPVVVEPQGVRRRLRRPRLWWISAAVLAMVGLVLIFRFIDILPRPQPKELMMTTPDATVQATASPLTPATATIRPTATASLKLSAPILSPTPQRPTTKPPTATVTRERLISPTTTLVPPMLTSLPPTVLMTATQPFLRPTPATTVVPRLSPVPGGGASRLVPVSPTDSARFTNGENDVIRLSWQNQEPLRPGEQFVVVIRFVHNNETWIDDQWTDATSLQVPAYLLDNATSDRFEWQVQVVREDPSGMEFGGSRRKGVVVGAPSAVRLFYWVRGAVPPGPGDNGSSPEPPPTWTPDGGVAPAPTWTPSG